MPWILAAYVTATVALSCVDLTYQWETSETRPEAVAAGGWYYEAGLRRAVFVVENDGHPRSGFHLDLHRPVFQLVPFLASVGPEGGATFVALWFIACIACGTNLALRRRGAPPKAVRTVSEN